MFKTLTLRGKIVFSISLVALLTFALSISVMTAKTRHMTQTEALDKGTEIAHRYASEVQSILSQNPWMHPVPWPTASWA